MPMNTAVALAPLVFCHDEERDLVRELRADRCAGRVVDAEEAEAIRMRRAGYVRRSMERAQAAREPGRRLASIGSGFFVSGDGLLLTNQHVIANCGAVRVSPALGESVPARLRAQRADIDLALLDTGLSATERASFASPDRPLPSAIAVVGYPNQGVPPVQPLLTQGRLADGEPSARGEQPQPFLIAADIRPGNSGGPALDTAGQVIGVVFAAVDTPKVFERTGRLVRDLGVAIPNWLTLAFLREAGVTPEIGRAGGAARGDLLTAARPIMARVECWQ